MQPAVAAQAVWLATELRGLELAYLGSGILPTINQHNDQNAARHHGLHALLQFAQALLQNVVAAETVPRLRHVAVFGGTQVGKSTVVNALCGSNSAQVHHTAGFTRHAQAFVPRNHSCDNTLAGFPHAFPAFQCVAVRELSIERPREYGVAELAGPPAIERMIFWDSPDCDAVDASRFREAMLQAVTVADAVVYVTSREKYAVNAILQWLLHLLHAGTPVVACLNMVPHEQQGEIIAAMQQALASVAKREGNTGVLASNSPHDIIAYDFMHGDSLAELFIAGNPVSQRLRNAVDTIATNASRNNRAIHALEYLEGIAPSLVQPALAQLEANAQWNAAVQMAVETFVGDYQSSYLDNPQRYDAFNRVGVEILSLLNPPIPGLRKALVFVRTALSLPARAIIYSTRAIWRYFSADARARASLQTIPNEVATFQDANDRLLNSLAGILAQRRGADQPFWTALFQLWAAAVAPVNQDFRIKLEQHRERTEAWIRETAQGIYQELAKDPVRLNLLRTGRISADAAAIIISIHTGGHGDILHDILVTPAMMSLVEAISQQLASSYVEQRRRELRERLLADIRTFAQDVYGRPMHRLGEDALQRSGFAGISAQRLKELQQNLHGLRDQLANANPATDTP